MSGYLQVPKNRMRPTNRGLNWLEVVVVLGIISVMSALLLPAVIAAREATRRMQCHSNLKQIGLGMHHYHDAHKTLPPAQILDADGKALHSWRLLITAFLEEKKLYEQIRLDEPWNSEHNTSLNPAWFNHSCPAASSKRKVNDETRKLLTDYQVVVGTGTPFERDRQTSFKELGWSTSTTYLVAEVTTAVPRFAPIDLPFELLDFGVIPAKNGIWSVGSHHSGGTNILLADGSTIFVKNSKNSWEIDNLKTMFLLPKPNNGNPVVITLPYFAL